MTNATASRAWDDVIARRHGKGDKADKTATTEAPATESEADIAKRVHAEEQQRYKDVATACSLAGKDDRVGGFIASGKTLREVLAILQAETVQRANGAGSDAATRARHQARLARHG